MEKHFELFLFGCTSQDRSYLTHVIMFSVYCSGTPVLGRVLLKREQTQFFRDEGQHPCQTRIPQLTGNYVKNLTPGTGLASGILHHYT